MSIDSILVAGTFGGGVFFTTDNGANWTPANDGLTGNGLDIRCLVLKGTDLFVGTDGDGVYRTSVDSKVWQKVSNGLPTDTIASESDTTIFTRIFGIGITGGVVLAGTADWHGLYRFNDNGQNWTPSGLQGECVTSFGGSHDLLFAGTCGEGGIHLSTDNGLNWRVSLGGEVTNAFAEINPISFAATNHGVFRTVDSGKTWKQVSQGLPKKAITAIAITDSILFTGGQDMGVYYSTNGGENWKRFDPGLPKNVTVYALAVHNKKIFAGTHHDGVWQRDVSDVLKQNH